jgi:hypothetical protein
LADASSVEAQAPLAIERDTPANPNAGKALLRRLRLDERFSMAPFSCLLGHIEPAAQQRYSFRVDTGTSDKKVRNRIGAADCSKVCEASAKFLVSYRNLDD